MFFVFLNHWCFWRHTLPCNQSGQCVIVNQWIQWVEVGQICIFTEPHILN